MNLPTAIHHSIQHNQHRVYYQEVADYLDEGGTSGDITPEDRAECIRTGEVWEIHWYPNTPIGFHRVAAPTLERAIARAWEVSGETRPVSP